MSPKIYDRRQFKRVYFSKEDNITATVTLDEKPNDPVSVFVLTVSEKGMSLFINRYIASNIKLGDSLTLKSVQMPKPLGTVDQIDVKVIYILSDNGIDYVSVGCKFIDVTDLHKQKIQEFVNYMHKKTENYS